MKRTPRCCVDSFKWSDHALFRWKQRFAGINKDSELGTARRMGKKGKRMVKELTPINSKKYLSNFNGRYCLQSRSNIVFIIQATEIGEPHQIVTVFHLYGERDR